MRVWIEEGPPGRESRPSGETEAAEERSQALTSSVLEDTDIRCRCCGRVLRSEKGIGRGTGWRCARRGGGADE